MNKKFSKNEKHQLVPRYHWRTHGDSRLLRMLTTSPTARCAYGAGLLLEAKKVHLALFLNAPSPPGFES